MDPIRFGLIGTGYWALHTHGTALSASPHADLHGVWGRDPGKADDLARRLGATGYPDLDELLANVDAVSLAVPPDVQAHIALRAARAGCHLLMDKPMALDVAAAEALMAAVEAADVAAIIFFTGRYRPDSERWTEAAREAGPWHSAHLVHYANIFQPGSPYSSSVWRREYGALWDIGPHALAAILPIMGRVMSVAARSGPVGSDTVHLVLSHAAPGTPAPVEIVGETVLASGLDLERAGEVVLSEGRRPEATPLPGALGPGPVGTSTISLSLTMPPAAIATGLALYGEHGVRVRPEGNFEAVDCFRVALDDLAEMVATGERRHRCDVHFGLEVVRVLAAAEQAMDLPAVELI